MISIPVQKHSINLWNWKKPRKEQRSLLWYDLEIPAKLFYKISEAGNIDLLIREGKPTLKQLETAWFSIIDRVYQVRKDMRAQNIQDKQVQIALLNHKIQAIASIIGVLYQILLTEKQQNELIEALKKLQIILKNPSKEEINRVLKRDLKGLKAKLKIEISRLSEMQKQVSKKMEYERICLKLSRAIDLKLDINMTLGEFLAAEAEAIEVSNNRRKNG